MKDLIQQIRNADGTELGYTLAHMAKDAADALEQQAAEIARLVQAIADHVTVRCEQAAVIEQMREALQYHVSQTRPIFSSLDAIDLQPCPEVLNKVKADAVAKFYDRYRKDDFAHIYNGEAEFYIQRLLKGEVES